MTQLATRIPTEKITTSTEVEKTAVMYLRVSSTGQLTGHSKEGYSIEG
jgi:hypothetical protein